MLIVREKHCSMVEKVVLNKFKFSKQRDKLLV